MLTQWTRNGNVVQMELVWKRYTEVSVSFYLCCNQVNALYLPFFHLVSPLYLFPFVNLFFCQSHLSLSVSWIGICVLVGTPVNQAAGESDHSSRTPIYKVSEKVFYCYLASVSGEINLQWMTQFFGTNCPCALGSSDKDDMCGACCLSPLCQILKSQLWLSSDHL